MQIISVTQGNAVITIPLVFLLAQPVNAFCRLCHLEVYAQLPPTAQLQTAVATVVYVLDHHWQSVSPVMQIISVAQGIALIAIPLVKLLSKSDLAFKRLLQLEAHVQLPPTAQLQTTVAGVVYVQDHHWQSVSPVMQIISVRQVIVQSILELSA